jgi:ferredoxin
LSAIACRWICSTWCGRRFPCCLSIAAPESLKSRSASTRKPQWPKRSAACTAGSTPSLKATPRTHFLHSVRRLRRRLPRELPGACLARPHLLRRSNHRATRRSPRSARRGTGRHQGRELGVIAGSAMLKDESRCIRCGLCAARCPAGTITMESLQPCFRGPNRLDLRGIHRPSIAVQTAAGRRGEEVIHARRTQAMTQKLPAEFDRRAFFTKIGLGRWASPPRARLSSPTSFSRPTSCMSHRPIVNAGKPESFAVNSVTMDVNSGIYLVRAERGSLRSARCAPTWAA